MAVKFKDNKKKNKFDKTQKIRIRFDKIMLKLFIG